MAAALALVGTAAAHADDSNPLTASPVDATTRQGQAVTIQLLGSGPVGDQLNYNLLGGFGQVIPTANGTVSLDVSAGFPPSRAIYTPNPGFSGTDTFQYTVNDFQFESAPATVTVTVSPVAADNHAPVASPLSVTCENPGQAQVQAAGTDVDGDVLTFAIASQPTHGSVALFKDGPTTQLVYSPEDGYVGPDSFTYTANDGVLTSDPATVSVTVTLPRENHVPTSVPPTVTTAQDTPVTFTIPATDLDGDAVQIETFGDALHGSISNLGDGEFTYTPDLGYFGADTFHYDVTDFRSTSYSYAVNVTVTAAVVPRHTPSVRAFAVVTRGEPVDVTLLGSDPDGDALSYTTASGPSHGTLSGSGANLVYTPDANYFGPDSFTYQASDGHHVSTPAIVKISVISAFQPLDPALDVSVSADERQSGKVVSPEFSTTGADRLIVAFISSDGPASSAEPAAQRVTSVQGGHLNWTLVKRANSTGGTAEVWQAHATSLLSAATVTAKFAKSGFDSSITVAAFANTPGAVGGAAAAAGKRGAPSATLTISGSGASAQVWAVGHDWSHAATLVPLPDQALVHTFSDRHVDDSFWTQRANYAYGDADVVVGLSSPPTDRWQFVAVAIPGLPATASFPGFPQ